MFSPMIVIARSIEYEYIRCGEKWFGVFHYDGYQVAGVTK